MPRRHREVAISASMHSPKSWEQTLGVARPHGVALLGELTCGHYHVGEGCRPRWDRDRGGHHSPADRLLDALTGRGSKRAVRSRTAKWSPSPTRCGRRASSRTPRTSITRPRRTASPPRIMTKSSRPPRVRAELVTPHHEREIHHEDRRHRRDRAHRRSEDPSSRHALLQLPKSQRAGRTLRRNPIKRSGKSGRSSRVLFGWRRPRKRGGHFAGRTLRRLECGAAPRLPSQRGLLVLRCPFARTTGSP
jgi:hypothetical protein